jgi:RimJ/RimL family protein N-acetyltransferase
MSFHQYLVDYANILSYLPALRYSFAILTYDTEHIGNCAYFNIDERQLSTEMGLMIGNRSYWNQGYGTDIVTTLVNHIFQKTNLKRIYLKTLESNIRAQGCFRKCGFTPYKHQIRDALHFVFMDLNRKQWQEKQVGESAEA